MTSFILFIYLFLHVSICSIRAGDDFQIVSVAYSFTAWKRCFFLFLVQAQEDCFCGGGDTTMDQICLGPIVSLPVKDFIKCHLAGGMVLPSQVFSLQFSKCLCVVLGYVTVIL